MNAMEIMMELGLGRLDSVDTVLEKEQPRNSSSSKISQVNDSEIKKEAENLTELSKNVENEIAFSEIDTDLVDELAEDNNNTVKRERNGSKVSISFDSVYSLLNATVRGMRLNRGLNANANTELNQLYNASGRSEEDDDNFNETIDESVDSVTISHHKQKNHDSQDISVLKLTQKISKSINTLDTKTTNLSDDHTTCNTTTVTDNQTIKTSRTDNSKGTVSSTVGSVTSKIFFGRVKAVSVPNLEMRGVGVEEKQGCKIVKSQLISRMIMRHKANKLWFRTKVKRGRQVFVEK